MENGLTRNQVINELSKSSHGKLEAYAEVVKATAKHDPEFLAHLIPWNREKGQVRDSKVALPILSIASPDFPEEFVDSSLAHFALLDVKLKEQGIQYLRSLKIPARRDRLVKQVLRAYLAKLEENFPKWERTAVMHRRRLKSLYVAAHFKNKVHLHDLLFGPDEPKVPTSSVYAKGSMFDAIARLGSMSPGEAAGTILERRIPSLVAVGSLGNNGGKLLKERDVIMALTQQMSPTEVVTRSASLAKKGAKSDPVIRAAFTEAAARVSGSSRNVLKTTRAAEALEEAGELELAAVLRGSQEKQIAKMAGIEGNWLLLVDKSGSMAQAIEYGRRIAAALAKFVKGEIHMVCFDTSPQHYEVSNKTYEQILAMTKFITANGGTSIGCGLQYAVDKQFPIDGIAIVSDAHENSAPWFATTLAALNKKSERNIPTYLYRVSGTLGISDRDLKITMAAAGQDLQEFDLIHGTVDYYSVPNLVQTMRANRYSLIDEIMGTRLLRLEDVLEISAAGRAKEARV